MDSLGTTKRIHGRLGDYHITVNYKDNSAYLTVIHNGKTIKSMQLADAQQNVDFVTKYIGHFIKEYEKDINEKMTFINDFRNWNGVI